MLVVEARGLERLTRDIFVACGVPEDDAAWVATLLVRANLRGHDSHGVIRVPSYVRGLWSGAVNPTAAVRVEGESETVRAWTGTAGSARWWPATGYSWPWIGPDGGVSERSRSAGRLTWDAWRITPRWPRPPSSSG